MIRVAALFFLFTGTLYGTSLRLQNESPCPLKAIVQGADGSTLKEIEVPSQKTLIWDDAQPGARKGVVASNPKKSMTPLTVVWVCLDGENFGVCDQISTGSLVSTKQCSGKKVCQPKEQKNE